MINIHSKTQKELDEEESLYRFAAAVVKSPLVKKACPTYLVKKDGTKVNTYDLTEQDVLTLINIDLRDFSNPNGSYKQGQRSGCDSFKLLDSLNSDFSFSHQGIITLMQMEPIYGNIVMDILGSADKKNLRGKARTIASYLKQSNGDFSSLTSKDIISVLEQMQVNEMNKRQQHSQKR